MGCDGRLALAEAKEVGLLLFWALAEDGVGVVDVRCTPSSCLVAELEDCTLVTCLIDCGTLD